MLLLELFDAVYDWEWAPALATRSTDTVATFAASDGDQVAVYFSNLGSGYAYELTFTKAGKFDVTSKGDAFKVFSTIIAIARSFFAVNHAAEALTFTSTNSSRTALYKKMLSKFAASDNFEFASTTAKGISEFALRRIEQPSQVDERWNRNRKRSYKDKLLPKIDLTRGLTLSANALNFDSMQTLVDLADATGTPLHISASALVDDDIAKLTHFGFKPAKNMLVRLP
jgi:hypothetical protein